MYPEGSSTPTDPRGQNGTSLRPIGNTPSFNGNSAGTQAPAQQINASIPEASSRFDKKPKSNNGSNQKRSYVVVVIAVCFLILLIGIVVWYINSALVRSGQLNSQSLQNQVDSITPTTISLRGLPSPLALQNSSTLLINGQVEVSNGIVLAPSTSVPSNPRVGQLYYDQTTNEPYYYNGSSFVGIKPASPQTAQTNTTVINNITNVTNNNSSTTVIQQVASSAVDLQSSSVTGVLQIAKGGTGATTAFSARTNLGAAGSGANNDITSLSGLTSALTVSQGGTGSTTFAINGILYGNGSNPLQVISAAPDSVLATNASGVPALTQTLPTAVQSNITGTGALTSGSIANGFGTITTTNNIGTSAILQGGLVLIGTDGAAPATVTLRAGTVSGNNATGGDLHIDASNGTGAGGSGSIVFRTAAAQSTPVTIDTTASGGSPFSPNTTASTSLTVGNHTNRLLMVAVQLSNAHSVSSITYNGVALTLLHAANCPNAVFASGCDGEIWYMLAPPTGSHTLTVTLTGSEFFGFDSASFYNVDQSSPFGAAQAKTGTSNVTSVTVASQPSQLVVDFIAGDHFGSQSPGASQSLTWPFAAAAPISSNQIGQNGNTTMTWTLITGANQSDYSDYTVPINQIPNSNPDTLSNAVLINASGNVGIGTNSPAYKLDVNGSGSFSTGVLSPLLDTATAVPLAIGTTNATAINLNQNTVIANNKSFTASGTALFTDATNSTTAFQVQNASASTVLNVDTTNSRVGIGTIAPNAKLSVSDMLFLDDFNRTDSASLGSNWTKRVDAGSDFQIVSNQLKMTSSDNSGHALSAYTSQGISSADYSVQSDITFPSASDDWMAVFGRGSTFGTDDTQGYYAFASMGQQKVAIYSRSAGTWTQISAAPVVTITPGTAYTLKLVMKGSNISLYWNGVLETSVSDTTFGAQGFAGISIGQPNLVNSIWDNFIILNSASTSFNVNNNTAITANGWLGIGTTTPSYALDVQGGTANFGNGLLTSSIDTASATSLSIGANNATSVGVGTATPGAILDILQHNQSGGTPIALKLTGGLNTNLTAANDPDMLINLNRAVQFAGSVTNGAANIANQHAIEIDAPGYYYSNTGNQTITNAVGMYINNPPSANGTGNTTITNSIGLMIDNANNLNQGGTITNAYGLYVNQPGTSGNGYGAYISSELVVGNNKTPPAHELVYLTQDHETGNNAQILHLSANQYTSVPVTDNPDVVFDMNHNIQFQGSAVDGAANLTSTNAFEITAPNYSYTNTGNQVIGSAATVYIGSGPTSTGGNTALTNSYGLLIDNAAAGGGSVNGYGLSVKAPTNAANNYAAIFQGGAVGVGTTTPKSGLDVNGSLAVGTYAGVNAAPTNGAIFSGNVGIGTNNPGSAAFAVQGSGNDMVTITSTLDTGFIRPFEMLDSSMTAGHNLVYHVGHDLSNNDSGYFGFNYQGANSANNFITMGLWGNDNIFNITGGGNVGIGDTGPSNKLKVVGSLCVKNAAGACAGNTSGTIYATNTTVQSADLAENYVSSQTLTSGDVVMPASDGDNQAVIRTTGAQSEAIGVISTQPGVTLNSDAKTDAQHPHLYPLALSGRVPVRVSTENGPISIGDYLTTSSTPGVAMRATKPGQTLGKALEDYAVNDPHTIGTVMTFINLSWADPGAQAVVNNNDPIGTLTSNPALFKALSNSTKAFEIQNTQGEALLTADTTNMKVTVANLVVQGTLTVNGHIVTGGTTPTITANPGSCQVNNASATVDGNDSSGTVTITTGTGCSGTDVNLATIAFAHAYGGTPRILISPNSVLSAHLLGSVSNVNETGFTINAGAAIENNTTYSWNYFIVQ